MISYVLFVLAAGSLLIEELSAQPSAAPPTSCLMNVQGYWGALAEGNFSKAMMFVTPNLKFSWPGDRRLLPMAGLYTSPQAIPTFFGIISQYFDFSFCASTPGPVIESVGADFVYAYWKECSPIAGSSYIPCPENLNQVQYMCDSATALISEVNVNLDNMCVGEALCNSTYTCSQNPPSTPHPSSTTATPLTTSPSCPNVEANTTFSIAVVGGVGAGIFFLGLLLGVVLTRCCEPLKRSNGIEQSLNSY